MREGATLEFDHIFIFVELEAPAVDRLVALGLTEGRPNRHPGQGTACRRFFFHNAMLELLWVRDAGEVRSAVIAPTRLWERSRSDQSGYSPFGLCFRPAGPGPPQPPFATWAYRPPYLPPHLQIDVAANAAHPAEPMIFCLPFGGRPDGYPAARQQPLDHPLGFREVTGLTLSLTSLASKSVALQALEADGFIAFTTGPAPLAELFFDGASTGRTADFRPGLPLVFHW